MTKDRDAKREVRARMRVTGERYTQARSALFGHSPADPPDPARHPTKGGAMVSEEILASLDEDGYAVVRDVASKQVFEELRGWVADLVHDDLEWRMREVQRRRDAGEGDARAFPRGMEGRFTFLVDDAPRRAVLADRVAEIAEAVGTPLPGRLGITACMAGWGGHDGLHPELDGPASNLGTWDAAVFTWPLTSPWEGIRLVPGSHRQTPVFDQPFAGAIAPHPDEVHLDAPPGAVVIYNVHIWKSGTLNRSDSLRSDISLTFKRDPSVSAQLADYWANAEIFDGGAPWDPGTVVSRDHETA